MIEISILDKNNRELFAYKKESIDVIYEGKYNEGDKVVIKKKATDFLAIQLDECTKESIIFTESNTFEFEIPFGALKVGYDEKAIDGNKHHIKVYEPSDDVKYSYRNISLNAYDKRGQKKYYPHAYANLVTREEPCFYERNAIDGVTENKGHGCFPYHSWAGGAREDLEYYLDFGAEVEVERIVFYLRADFPHDTYWKSVDVEFDDKETITAYFEKTSEGQELSLSTAKTTKKIHLTNFKQAEMPFSWAALSQIEVYGRYIKEHSC